MAAFNHERLREIRERRGLTVRRLAELCDLSPSFISQIERGRTEPTLTRFWRICDVLDVPMSLFFIDGEADELVVRREERRVITFPGSGVLYQSLSAPSATNLEVILVEIEPGGAQERERVTHRGEECGFVLAGELTVLLDDREIHLREGDAVSFDSSHAHRYTNPGDRPSRSVWAMIRPPGEQASHGLA